MSIIMVAIILKTSIPLLIETSKILMNSVPHHIQINDLKKRLHETIPAVKNVHELHVWQLAGEKIIGKTMIGSKNTAKPLKECEGIIVFPFMVKYVLCRIVVPYFWIHT